MDERKFEQTRHEYTAEEMTKMHEELVVKLGEWDALREQKVQATSLLNAQIKTAEKAVFDLREKLSSRGEWIDVEVVEVMDKPKPGWKSYCQIDNMDNVIRSVPMSAREKQEHFSFTDLPDTGPAGAPES